MTGKVDSLNLTFLQVQDWRDQSCDWNHFLFLVACGIATLGLWHSIYAATVGIRVWRHEPLHASYEVVFALWEHKMGRVVLSCRDQLPPAFSQCYNKESVGFSLLFFSCLLESSTQKGISPGLPSGSFHEGINAGLCQFVLLYSFPTCPPSLPSWLVFSSPQDL